MPPQDVKVKLIPTTEALENTGSFVKTTYCKYTMFWAMHSLLPGFMSQNDHLRYKNWKQIPTNNPKLSASLCRTLLKMVSTNVVPPAFKVSLTRSVAICSCGGTGPPLPAQMDDND